MSEVNAYQIGGAHYKTQSIQHWDMVIQKLDNRYLEGCATKYISRWREKGGFQDLEKALHYLGKLLEAAIHGQVQPIHGRVDMSTFSISEFCRGCACNPQETIIITHIATWASVPDLTNTVRLMREYLEQVRENEQQWRAANRAAMDL